MKQIINTVIKGFFWDTFTVICLLLTPIWLPAMAIYTMRKRTKTRKCIVCKDEKRRIDEDGICQQCNASLDELFDDINGEPAAKAEEGQVPWMSIEVVPAGMPEKQMANIDIRIDSDTGMLYTVKNGIYREIGADM